MSTVYGREGIRQVCATLLGARHVPERLCGGSVLLEALYQVFDLYLYLYHVGSDGLHNFVVVCNSSLILSIAVTVDATRLRLPSVVISRHFSGLFFSLTFCASGQLRAGESIVIRSTKGERPRFGATRRTVRAINAQCRTTRNRV